MVSRVWRKGHLSIHCVDVFVNYHINHQSIYIYIYIYERPYLKEHEVLPSGVLLEDSLAIKDMDFFFFFVHRFKTIPLSLTKIITLCLLNKHQLKDNDSLFFLGTLFQDYFFLFRFSPLALLLIYIPLPIVFYIILTQMHIWDSLNRRGCKRLAVLMRRSEVIGGFVRVVIGYRSFVVWDFSCWSFCVGFTMMCD